MFFALNLSATSQKLQTINHEIKIIRDELNTYEQIMNSLSLKINQLQTTSTADGLCPMTNSLRDKIQEANNHIQIEKDEYTALSYQVSRLQDMFEAKKQK